MAPSVHPLLRQPRRVPPCRPPLTEAIGLRCCLHVTQDPAPWVRSRGGPPFHPVYSHCSADRWGPIEAGGIVSNDDLTTKQITVHSAVMERKKSQSQVRSGFLSF